MSRIKSKDTQAEILLRKRLWALGYRYRKNYTSLPGKPDIVFLKQKVAIFIDGEFWHGYQWQKKKKRIQSNSSYWIQKIERNMKRDRKNNRTLRKMGWVVVRIWSADASRSPESCIARIQSALLSRICLGAPE